MIVSRIIYGNAIGGEGRGWRVLNSSSNIVPHDLALFENLCGTLYEKLPKGASKVFFGKRSGNTLVVGHGILYGKDANGRPGGWWFFGGIVTARKLGIESALELSQVLFADCESWLDESHPLQPKGMDAPVSSPKSLVRGFWSDLLPDAEESQRILSNNSPKAKSYCFPVQSAISGFSVCIPYQKSGSISHPTPRKRMLLARWSLVALLAFLLVADDMVLKSSIRAKTAENQRLVSEVGEKKQAISRLQKGLESAEQRCDGLNKQIEGLEREQKDRDEKIASLEERNTALQKNASKALKKRNRELEVENEHLKQYISSIMKWKDSFPDLVTDPQEESIAPESAKPSPLKEKDPSTQKQETGARSSH